MSGLGKRLAEVPQEARDLADDAATMHRLYEEANTWRENREEKPLASLDALRAKWARRRAS